VTDERERAPELLRETRSMEPEVPERSEADSEVRTVVPAEEDDTPEERCSDARCESSSGGIHVDVDSSSGSSSGEGSGELVVAGDGGMRVGVNKLRVSGVKTPAPESTTGELRGRGCSGLVGCCRCWAFWGGFGGAEGLDGGFGVAGSGDCTGLVEALPSRCLLAAMFTEPSELRRRLTRCESLTPSPRMHRSSSMSTGLMEVAFDPPFAVDIGGFDGCGCCATIVASGNSGAWTLLARDRFDGALPSK